MKRTLILLLSAVLATAASTPVFAGQGQSDEVPAVAGRSDNPPHPLGQAQAAARRRALQAKLNGKAKGKTHQVARGQYVELARQGEDSIWTVVGQFGNLINPTYGGTPGPLRNQIPEPDRTVDNTTIWAPDFSRAYFEQLLFDGTKGANSMRNYYVEQSSRSKPRRRRPSRSATTRRSER
jgi:immune inhibitor A